MNIAKKDFDNTPSPGSIYLTQERIYSSRSEMGAVGTALTD